MKSRLRLRHLQALIALTDLRSMGRAAQAFGISQPAMSNLVAEMERLLETPLFLRHSKGVDPTLAAQDLYPIALRIIGATEEAAERIASRMTRESGFLKICATAAAQGAILDKLLPLFVANHPQIKLQINVTHGLSLDAGFDWDEFEIVCCRAPKVIPDGWCFSPVASDEMAIICGINHPLVSKTNVAIRDLKNCIWLQDHVSTMARRLFEELCEREGWDNPQEVHVHSQLAETIWAMLRGDDYVVLIPRSVVSPWLGQGLLHDLRINLDLKLEPLGYLWNAKRAGFATRLFVEALDNLS